jgi:hypothetical protein
VGNTGFKKKSLKGEKMKLAIKFLLVLPLMLFGNIDEQSSGYSFRDVLMEKNIVDPDILDQAERACHELLGASISGESKEDFFENLMSWWANEENQQRILQRLVDHAEKAGLSSSADVVKMLDDLRVQMEEFTEAYNNTHQPVAALKQHTAKFCAMTWSYSTRHREPVNKENAEERIQELREEEKWHKDQAFDLGMQALGESCSGGMWIVAECWPLAAYEEFQATRHLLKGADEYNAAVKCQKEADEIEKKYFKDENEDPEKGWWEFWK